MKLGYAVLAVIVIIVVIAAVALLLSGGAPTLSTSKTLSLSRNSTYSFHLAGDSNLSSVMVESVSGSNSVVYIGRTPILLNDMAVVQLSTGQSANVSLIGSSTADLGISLVSVSGDSATLNLTYLPSSFGVKVSSGVKMIRPEGTVAPTGAQTTAAATTIEATTTVAASTTTVAVSTTTALNVNLTAQAIISANGTAVGKVITGFSGIFIKQHSECTQQTYDIEFAAMYGTTPSGSLTFQNASLVAPEYVTSSAQSLGNNIYNITYTEVVPSGNRHFATVEYNMTGNYTTTSVFNGDFGRSYSAVLENYTTISQGTDKCTIFGV
jgi:hypothetical protein